MEWGPAAWWWAAAGLAVAFELVTGTFHLLMLALGLMAGALAAHAGLGGALQIVCAAIVGGAAVAALVLRRPPHSVTPATQADHNALLDIGERVQVDHWTSDGTARVQYRGAQWWARYAGPGDPSPGEHVIQAIEGNRLILRR